VVDDLDMTQAVVAMPGDTDSRARTVRGDVEANTTGS
jgi:hypothetical protein